MSGAETADDRVRMSRAETEDDPPDILPDIIDQIILLDASYVPFDPFTRDEIGEVVQRLAQETQIVTSGLPQVTRQPVVTEPLGDAALPRTPAENRNRQIALLLQTARVFFPYVVENSWAAAKYAGQKMKTAAEYNYVLPAAASVLKGAHMWWNGEPLVANSTAAAPLVANSTAAARGEEATSPSAADVSVLLALQALRDHAHAQQYQVRPEPIHVGNIRDHATTLRPSAPTAVMHTTPPPQTYRGGGGGGGGGGVVAPASRLPVPWWLIALAALLAISRNSSRNS